MKTVNMQEAKTHLSKLVDSAAKGEPFIIAKAGRPMVKVERIVEKPPQRIGFMVGQFEVPDDFDAMFADEIKAMFYGSADGDDENAKE
jgi:antitoxin (DNA-binding transcriptional repressor) of toxin-antitoxin stability system